MNTDHFNEDKSIASWSEESQTQKYLNELKNLQLFDKGDFVMLIVPPATQEFALSIAVSTCGKVTDRVGNIKVPKLKGCVFIDTISSKKKLKADAKKAKSYINGDFPIGFKLANARDVYTDSSGDFDMVGAEADTLKHVANYVETEGQDSEGIFVMLDSVIFGPNNFDKKGFDDFLAWASKLKIEGKTLVVMSHYRIAHEEYLTENMNVVINCIPDQRGTSCGMCAFSINMDFPNHESSSVEKSSLNTSFRFALIGLMGFENDKRMWSSSPAIFCLSDFDSYC